MNKLMDAKYIKLMIEKLNHLEREFWELNKELTVFTDRCLELLNERQLNRSQLSNIELASLTLFRKASDSFHSMLLLYKEKLWIDASVILRHLLNLLMWFKRVITPEDKRPPDHWALRYIEWPWVFEYRELQKIKDGKSERSHSLLSRESEIIENYERVKHLYINERGNLSKYWYGNTIKECVKDEDLGLLETYERAYSYLSGAEHADYFTLSRLEDKTRLGLYCIENLKLNFEYFRIIIKYVADYFDLQDTQCLDDMHQKAQKLDSLLFNLYEDLTV